MLQRIQTVYLVLALIISVIFLFLPLGEFTIDSMVYLYKVRGIFPESGNGETVIYPFGVIALVAAHIIITLLTIFLFKNRLLQIKLGKFNVLILTGLLVAVFYYVEEGSSAIKLLSEQDVTPEFSYGLSCFLPVLSIVLVFLANRAIRKDEQLVRSVDRLR